VELLNNSLSSSLDSTIALQQLTGKGAKQPALNATGESLNSFGQLLKDQLAQINQLQSTANQAVETYAVGGDIELHNVVLAVEKADMALQLATQVRNKLVSAYQEVSRMQF